ncbi:hypothetical protein M3Y98_00690500 [Aphelenchoides besseyi]|nr:hypothetical protein M3Y98_00690500 [Aphelenchoides besseyi]
MGDSDGDYEFVEKKGLELDKSTQTTKYFSWKTRGQKNIERLSSNCNVLFYFSVPILTLMILGVFLGGNRLVKEDVVSKQWQMLIEQNSILVNKIANLEHALARLEERTSKQIEQQDILQLQTSESMKQKMETDGNDWNQELETERPQQTNRKEATNETATTIEVVSKIHDDVKKNQTMIATTFCTFCRFALKGQLYGPYFDSIPLNSLFTYSISVVAAFCCCMIGLLFIEDSDRRQSLIECAKDMVIMDALLYFVCGLMQYFFQ